jgi:eukaryotic-like serine/threonine-protein kinase
MRYARPPMAADTRDLSGTVIADRYQVERKLGSGGMGSVWLVRHVESLQRYALKTLHPDAARDAMSVERFLREARAAAALHSKHVVKIVDSRVGHVEGGQPMPFLVMELLQGQNLEQAIASRRAIPAEEVVHMMRQVARALDLAHSNGIIHRDLKPENLFIHIDEDGDPVIKVCDFGIAKLTGEVGEGIAQTGSLGTTSSISLGTPMYMSPEQIRDSSAVVPASDQWPLALIVFKALTGADYFGSSKTTGELLGRILGDPIDAPSVRASSLPPAFDAWFLRTCDRKADNRWPSVSEQVRALAAALGVTAPTPAVLSPGVRSTEPYSPSAPTMQSGSPPKAVTTGAASTNAVTAARPPARRRLFAAAFIVAVTALGVALLLRRSADPPQPVVSSTSQMAAPTQSSTPTPAVAPTPSPMITAPPSISAPPTPSTIHTIAPAKPKPSAAPSPSPSPSVAVAKLLPKGAPCERSAQCASGFCAAEKCQ